MSEQALETVDYDEDETVIAEEEQAEEVTTEEVAEEVEVVLDGEEEPTSKPVPRGFLKRINKLNGKVEAANSEAEEARRRADALEEENRLLRMKTQQKPLTRPKAEDFATDAEYESALDKYDEQRLREIADRRLSEHMEASQQRNTQAAHDEELRVSLTAHYERAEGLKVTDYEETEDRAISILGNDTAKQIMANTVNSEVILYHLGKNPAKAERLLQLIQENPIKGVAEIGRLDASQQETIKYRYDMGHALYNR